MGYKEYEFGMAVERAESEFELSAEIRRRSKLGEFSFRLLKKSLDARRKGRIEWRYRVGVSSPELSGDEPAPLPTLKPQRARRDGPVVVVGTGPAGVFAALYLLRAGYQVTLIERGDPVEARRAAITAFEAGGTFSAHGNYSFGEGGAGTFSDGKLSSRSKGITAERNFIFETLIKAGAPAEIHYMTHPHVGSDILYQVTQGLRAMVEAEGGRIMFRSLVSDIRLRQGRVSAVECSGGVIDARWVVCACGHSAYETYRMLLRRGVPFGVKNSALGFRAEHPQELINEAQWGRPTLAGVKAAEYRLTAQTTSGTGVYSFCMCPGGAVVPAAAYAGTNVVNGMSNYARDGRYANAAVVAGLNLRQLLGRELEAAEALDWVAELEHSFYDLVGGYRAPCMRIAEFLQNSTGRMAASDSLREQSSYPLGLAEHDLRSLLPSPVVGALQEGLAEFCRKLKGYETGLLLGLESKSSAPVQVERDPVDLHAGYRNLFITGEGSGWSGGIVSSAADGLRVAQAITHQHSGS